MSLFDSSAAGTVTFLFTDIEGSTQLWEQFPEAMKGALRRHDDILRSAIEGRGGRVVKATGDGMMGVFGSATDAVTASLAVQRGMGLESWVQTNPLRVRIGVHAGQADQRDGDFFGPTVNRTARIMAAGHGGQVLLSGAAAALVADGLPDGASLADLGEHRLKDLDRPEHVYQLRHPDLAASFPPLATVRQATATLPARVAEIVGRATELANIESLLSDRSNRLVTLTGPGGTGKTTLAVRVAETMESRYANGAAFVDLSNARDANSVMAEIARALGLDDVVERPLLDEISSQLRGQEVLLVLDNLEQVTEAAGMIAQLLLHCSGLTVLATSRETLHVRAERVLQIAPLSAPPPDAHVQTATEIGRYEAVQLFVDRARSVRPEFDLTDDNAPVVAEICRRLDGLPLAIELAAARLSLFSVEVLRDRLGDRLGLLRSGPRDLPERQQTLRATMDWSYELLEPDEQRLFALLGAFADASIDDLESVVDSLGELNGLRIDAVDGLAGLIEKSLVRQIEEAGSEPRITMLETIREFARDRLAQRADLHDQARRAHATHYSHLAETARTDLSGTRRQTALAVLATDSANLRLCWDYWVSVADVEHLNRLVVPLMALDDDRGWYLNTVRLTSDMLEVLKQAGATPDNVTQEIALRTSLARALMATRGVTTEVEDAFNSALELFEKGGDTRQQYSVLRGLASLYLFQGQLDKVLVLADEILALGEREDDAQIRIDAHLLIGAFHITTANPHLGMDYLNKAIAMFEGRTITPVRGVRLGNDPRVACYTTAALALQIMGFPEQANKRADAAVELADRLEHPFTTAYARFHAGLQRLFQRDAVTAHSLATSLLEVAEEHGFRIWIAAGRVLLGASRVGIGRVDEGLADISSGMSLYQELRSPPVFWPFVLYVSASATYAAGRPADMDRLEAAIGMLSDPAPGSMMLPALQLLKGDILMADAPNDTKSRAEAEALYRLAFERATELDLLNVMLRAAARIAKQSAPGEQRAEAIAQLESVYGMVTEGFETADVVEAREALAALRDT